MPKYKILNVMTKKGRVITKKPFISERIIAKTKAEAIKEAGKETRRWNNFSKKAHKGEGFRTKVVEAVKIK